MKERILELLDIIEPNIGLLSDVEAREVESLVSMAMQKFRPQEVIRSDVPEGVESLWVLAGGNPKAFKAYLKTFPNAQFNQFAQNKLATDRLIDRFSNQFTFPYGEVADGIPKAEINSSNVYGFQYDPRNKSLRVKFNGKDTLEDGPVYEYDNVPPFVFKMFANGAIPAKTDGSNKWGSWWKNKSPSLGSSMHNLIKLGGFSYKKLT
jgi:hypothetical protein